MGGHRRDFGFRSARIEAPLKGPEPGSGLCDVRFRKILSATAFRMTCHEAREGRGERLLRYSDKNAGGLDGAWWSQRGSRGVTGRQVDFENQVDRLRRETGARSERELKDDCPDAAALKAVTMR